MKILSLILKIVALLAAAFCVYAWFDVKGRIKDAETHMADIKGATLVEKAPNAAIVNKENNQNKIKIKAFEKRVSSLDKELQGANSELESERAKNVSANADIARQKVEIRDLNSKLATVSKQVGERESTIEELKKEILAKQELLARQGDMDSLKDKIADLERKLSEQGKELANALEKAKIADMSEIVEVIDTNAEGQKVKRKIIKVPYAPKGEMATVISVDAAKGVIAINKGKADGLREHQAILLKRGGVVVAEALVGEVADDIAALVVNKDSVLGKEYIALNEQFELASPVIEKKPEAGEKAEEKSEDKAEDKKEAAQSE